ncbi:MAG TPA: hypothetical protein VJH03_26635 [Blastocatellia bacterium]|nr:hypothetical protein [Blastocatellia bacterium]
MDCLTNEDMNSYLAGSVADDARDRFETHLGRCRACCRGLAIGYVASRPEQAAAPLPRWLKARVRSMSPGGRIKRPSFVFGARMRYAGAAAAVLLAIGLSAVLLIGPSERLPNDRLRQEEQISTAPKLLAPVTGARLSSDLIEFRWAKVQGAESYSLTLLNEKGDVLVSVTAIEERAVMNAAGRFESGKSYFWYVTAKSPDGVAVVSLISKFSFER